MIYICHTIQTLNNSVFGDHYKADFRLASENKILGIVSLFSEGQCLYEKGKEYEINITPAEKG